MDNHLAALDADYAKLKADLAKFRADCEEIGPREIYFRGKNVILGQMTNAKLVLRG